MHVCIYYVRMYICMYVYTVFTDESMYVCMFVCKHVGMCVCMYKYVYVYMCACVHACM